MVTVRAGGHRRRSRHHPDGAVPRGREGAVFDAGYSGADKRPELADRDISWNIAIRRSIIKALPKASRELAEPVERALAQVRAVAEHPFHIIKNRFHHNKKLRYRGLAKNTAQLHTPFVLASLMIVKQALLAQSRPYHTGIRPDPKTAQQTRHHLEFSQSRSSQAHRFRNYGFRRQPVASAGIVRFGYRSAKAWSLQALHGPAKSGTMIGLPLDRVQKGGSCVLIGNNRKCCYAEAAAKSLHRACAAVVRSIRLRPETRKGRLADYRCHDAVPCWGCFRYAAVPARCMRQAHRLPRTAAI